MKLLHIADLHIGKRVNEFNLASDQEYILNQLLDITATEEPDGILIAGDVYDKSQPSAEAFELLDEFLTKLLAQSKPVFIISGNHDSPERLSFGSRIMRKNGLHIAGVFSGRIESVPLEDAHGRVNVYLLPYLKPAMVKPYFEQDIESYEDAVRAVLSSANVDTLQRNVLVAHQFVTFSSQQPERSDSESISVGGMDNVDASVFDAFDYVALGHIHGPQKIGRDTIRYAGSPLKYSFSEARHIKSATLIELGSKGDVKIKTLPLKPLRDMRRLRGPIAELIAVGRADPNGAEDYIHATLTDEEEIYDAIGQLREVYPNLMALEFDNSRSRSSAAQSEACCNIAAKSPVELFSEFYTAQNNIELSDKQLLIMRKIFEQAGGAEL